ncbi:MAG TPA: hypothetical protein VG796_18055 [Verrucomicrobiales bacterium]|jgi:hypothetical protein|nr:hypothetical protein [Verrucomicrobiales bacterium]
MKTVVLPFLFVAFHALLVTDVQAGETGSLDKELEAFRPWLGKTWKGRFKSSTPEKPVVDVARWERALNGKAVRVLHSVNDGSYGGESIIRWDAEKKTLVYYYFTTAGFMTSGTMTISGGVITGMEKVTGGANGIAEVRSTTEIRADGTMLSKAEYLKDGKPSGGREVTYKEDAKAEVKWK